MKRLVALSLLSLFCTLNIIAGTDIVYMNVGDTRTLRFNAPPYIVGTQWTISDQDAIKFVTNPGSTSTCTTIKALSPRSAANRVIVHCTYYYRELDPTTGRYEYQRTGYQDWEIIITGSGGGGGGNNSDKRFVNLNIHSAEITCGKNISLNATVGNGSSDKFTWTSSNPAVALISTTGKSYASVYAEGPGKAIIRVSISNGAYDECIITVYDNFMFELNEDKESYSVSANYSLSGEITIPSFYNGKPVTTIATAGFQYQDGIQKLNIPNTIRYIGDFTFYQCTNLTSITIPNSVIGIGNGAFYGCGIEKLYFNADNCESCGISSSPAFPPTLKTVYIGENVMSIPSCAFINCGRLKSVIIPSSVTFIGDNAFSWCEGLTKAEFASIESLCSIKFANSGSNPLYYAHNLYIGGTEVTDIEIPETVTGIGNYAFSYCTCLTSVTIPESVTSIGNYAFTGCSALTSVYYTTSNPIKGSPNIFSDYEKPTLYVPAEAADKCKVIDPWKRFQKIIEVNENGEPVCSECVYIVGTLNGWDFNDYSYSLNKIGDNNYQGSVYFEKGANQEFIVAYKNGEKTYLFHYDNDNPIIKETSISDPNCNRVITYTNLTTSDRYNIKLPSNWPGGIVDMEITRLDPDKECSIIFTAEKSKMNGIEECFNDEYDEAIYFNLHGVKIGNNISELSPGIYIKRQGLKAEKIFIK